MLIRRENGHPVATATVARFIHERIDELGKSTADVAKTCGFATANIISMIRHGKSPLPVKKIASMARALEVDPGEFFEFVIREYDPEAWSMVDAIISRRVEQQLCAETGTTSVHAASPDT